MTYLALPLNVVKNCPFSTSWDLFLGLESRRAWYCSNFVHSSCKSFTRFASLGKAKEGVQRAWEIGKPFSSCHSNRFTSLTTRIDTVGSTVGTKTETLFNCRWIGLWYFMISSGGHTDELHLYPVLTLLCGIRGVDSLIVFNCTVSTNASGCLVIVSFGTSFTGSPIVSQPLGRVPGLLLTPEAPEGEKNSLEFPTLTYHGTLGLFSTTLPWSLPQLYHTSNTPTPPPLHYCHTLAKHVPHLKRTYCHTFATPPPQGRCSSAKPVLRRPALYLLHLTGTYILIKVWRFEASTNFKTWICC